jgi:Lhr-like helicase
MEVLIYVLNHNKEIASLSNLFIFDEGHQFDNGSRGITYELLLTTLLLLIPTEAQKILISAVIKNGEQISDWLNGEINVVSGKNLTPTYKTVGFVSWISERGQIRYVKDENKTEDDFFVPRVIEQRQLQKLGKERKIRNFPEKNDTPSISLFLGLKLVSNGSVAIFCGIKSAVSSVLKKLIDILNFS